MALTPLKTFAGMLEHHSLSEVIMLRWKLASLGQPFAGSITSTSKPPNHTVLGKTKLKGTFKS